MATFAGTLARETSPHPVSRPRAQAGDRWIFAFMAAMFILLSLLGFVPDSLTKIAAVAAGKRHHFPLIMHIHAVLMGAFLAVLLAQAVLATTGRAALHRRLGVIAALLVPVMVVVGIILVPTTYRYVWDAAQHAPAGMRAELQRAVFRRDDVMLLQLRMGVLFPLFMAIGLRARKTDTALHKRMIILAVAMLLPPAIDRILWLPSTLPASPLSAELFILLAVSPMLIRDLVRSHAVHKAYLIWLGINLPFAVAVHGLWGTTWWYSVAPGLMMV